MITANEAHRFLDYRPETGEFFRKTNAGGFTVGSKAGTSRPDGYMQICINRRHYLAHRIAWLMMTGEWPTSQIDHINCDKTDTRFANLREASAHQNRCNLTGNRRNTSGFKGVSRAKGGRWQAHICCHRKQRALGTFDTPEQAHAAYALAAAELFGKFARP